MDIGKIILIVVGVFIFTLGTGRAIELFSTTESVAKSTISAVEDKSNIIPVKTTDTTVSFEIPSSQVICELLYLDSSVVIKINGNPLDSTGSSNNSTIIKNQYEGYLNVIESRIQKDSFYKREYTTDTNGQIKEVDYIRIS